MTSEPSTRKPPPKPDEPPDHAFRQPTGPPLCQEVVGVTDTGYTVYCGLKKNQHAKDKPQHVPPWDKATGT